MGGGQVLCMMLGPMLVSLMTATLSRNMALNVRETRLMATLDRDALSAKLVVTATQIIQSWARGRLQVRPCPLARCAPCCV